MSIGLAIAIYLLFAFGVAYVIGRSQASDLVRGLLWKVPALRWLVAMLECPACFGFWIGLASAHAAIKLNIIQGPPLLLGTIYLVAPFATAASNFLLAKHTKLIK